MFVFGYLCSGNPLCPFGSFANLVHHICSLAIKCVPFVHFIKGRHTPDAIRQRDAIFQFFNVDKTAYEGKL